MNIDTEYKIELLRRLKDYQCVHWKVKILSDKNIFEGLSLDDLEFAVEAVEEILGSITEFRDGSFSVIDIPERRTIHHMSANQCKRYLSYAKNRKEI